MIKRRLYKKIKELLGFMPAVVLIGPRQVGKTTLAHEIARKWSSVYLDLERPGDLAKIEDIELFHRSNSDKLVILDEVQRSPELFAPLRGIIDQQRREGRTAGMFLFLGSASIDLLRQSGETLAGRIALAELHPLDALEIGEKEDLTRLWLRGGFPQSYLAKTDAQSMTGRLNFIRTYLERDIPQLGPRIPAETLRRFWTMLAHNQGTMLNASNLARGLAVSGQTVTRYLDLLVDLLLVRRLTPWASNAGKRMVKSPKVYVRDSGITHALLGLESYNDLLGHPVLGGSWEGFVVENIMAAAPERMNAFFYRTAGGAEIDLLLEIRPGKFWAVEIKHSTAPKLSKGFALSCDEVKAERRFVVYPGTDSYPMDKKTMVMSLRDMMSEVLAQ